MEIYSSCVCLYTYQLIELLKRGPWRTCMMAMVSIESPRVSPKSRKSVSKRVHDSVILLISQSSQEMGDEASSSSLHEQSSIARWENWFVSGNSSLFLACLVVFSQYFSGSPQHSQRLVYISDRLDHGWSGRPLTETVLLTLR